MNKLASAMIAALLLGPLGALHAAELRLPRIFGDHMVLQRDKPVKVWGWAESGARITVEFAGQTKTAIAAADGTWQVVLDPMPVSAQGRTLTVKSAAGNRQSAFQDALVGDVGLGSGQSNLELELGGHPGLL